MIYSLERLQLYTVTRPRENARGAKRRNTEMCKLVQSCSSRFNGLFPIASEIYDPLELYSLIK